MADNKKQRHRWTREDEILSLELYHRLAPKEEIKATNPKIQALAQAFKTTPASIVLKLQNYRSLDKSCPDKGLVNASRLSQEIAAEFMTNRTALFQQADTLKQQYGLDADYRPVARMVGSA